MISDSHVHLHLINYGKLFSNLQKIILSAQENKIKYQLCVSTNIYQHREIIFICKKYKNIFGSVGIHPNEQYSNEDISIVDKLLDLSKNSKIKAIGETGLDYLNGVKNRKKQIKRFEQHIEASITANLPIIVHSRCAKHDIINILSYYYKIYGLKGVLHCFSDDVETAKQLVDIGFNISFSGLITFKNNIVIKNVAKYIPIENILIETDSPYLAPDPYRGRINEPKYLIEIARNLSIIKEKPIRQIVESTTNNFIKLFRI